ncbi:MAG: hypothetical protein M1829_003986 [Trizodia sp. TS-e1964]|nr:MAG: hypothetical protein M1829_003986 [Trizodia sp. TS-e1964]
MVEAPLDLQKSLTIPDDHYQACRAAGVPIAGNAAGNTKDFYDLNGQNLAVSPLPAGQVCHDFYELDDWANSCSSFTVRGIVALVFSVIAAFVGLAVIAWYGFGEIGASEIEAARKRIAASHVET